eukprot:scaffold87843_cov60-Phaeocystis_antarctica.AAC.3
MRSKTSVTVEKAPRLIVRTADVSPTPMASATSSIPLSAGEASEAGVVKASALVQVGSSALGRRVIPIVDAVHIGDGEGDGRARAGARGYRARVTARV